MKFNKEKRNIWYNYKYLKEEKKKETIKKLEGEEEQKTEKRGEKTDEKCLKRYFMTFSEISYGIYQYRLTCYWLFLYKSAVK